MIKKVYFERKIDASLLSWARESGRKPLLLRGARQVGKSSAVRNFGKYENIEIYPLYAISNLFII